MIAGRRGTSGPNTPIRSEVTTRSATHIAVDNVILKMGDYLDGHLWTVDYYRQSTASEDINLQLDNNNVSSQHYFKYNRMDLNLTEPINSSNLSNINGEFLISMIAPQVNDLFKAVIPSGNVAVFRVTTVTPVSYNTQTHYKVEFSIDTLDSVDPSRLVTLETKVVRTYHFKEDGANTNGSKFLASTEYEFTTKAEMFLEYVVEDYFKMFSGDVLSYEKDGKNYYCPVVEDMVSSIMTAPHLINTSLKRSKEYNFTKSIYSTRPFITYYFSDKALEKDSYESIQLRNFLPSSVDKVVQLSKDIDTFELPTFSSYFYDGDDANPYFLLNDLSTSTFNLMFKKYLNGQSIELDDLITLMDMDKTNEEMYYYMPIIVAIIKHKLGSIYSY